MNTPYNMTAKVFLVGERIEKTDIIDTMNAVLNELKEINETIRNSPITNIASSYAEIQSIDLTMEPNEMNQPNTIELLIYAQTIDTMMTDHHKEFIGICNMYDAASLKLKNTKHRARWLELLASNEYDQDKALNEARKELAELQVRIDAVQKCEDDIVAMNIKLDQAISGVTCALFNRSMELKNQRVRLEHEISGSQQHREDNIRVLIEMGVPEDVAQTSARPTIEQINVLKTELDLLPEQEGAARAHIGSHVSRLLLVYPELKELAQ